MGDYMDLEVDEWEGLVDEFEDVGRWEYERWMDREGLTAERGKSDDEVEEECPPA
eukprot:CAMPEP_0197567322 /NCGR_PEP_ID=MMETSP1320-20131121/35419_1 /TAXON_ID=91990 /ORGANISM="Bolidomonas sp., Strain RCC2347" /LENGTH=54 /DNA_ID=CAMNT_0043129495 /DNA_START=12 /DNA_END=172 /DNA_ORIENTATION=+